MKSIKNYSLLLLLLAVVLSVISCKRNDGARVPISTDNSKPGVITNVKVNNYNGGSYITYQLPNSQNILYVLAKYQIRDNVPRETKSSYYSDTVTVEGFAKEQDYDVTLYTVSRADVLSDPVTVKVHPKTPAYISIRSTTTMTTDFGGVNVKAFNPLKKEIGVIVTAFNKATNTMEIQDQHYTTADTIDYSVRGYSTDPRSFGVYVTDKYGNISDTLKKSITPLFEQLLDKSKFSPYNLPSDTEIGYGWVLPNLWDGKTDGNSAGWHTNPGHTPPFVCTFNVGLTYKLSRFIIWERPDQYAFGHGNPKLFSLWGSNVASPQDAQLPVSSAVGTVVGDWTNLGNFRYPNPPSGLPPGATNAADNAFVLAGVNFNISISAPAVHFIRVAVGQTWSGGNFAHIMELSFYGTPQ
ncbi:DUF5000 domain-containing lipoprotein [Mucilaginibacter lappiensis]|uniref:DUF4959 domain-containing protein n=1 Tax=Mucilaginibacter lappiensis TaxID=354630 RepID=A0A1N6NNL2_9SPHI|nr:DUF5000 domain-containing lipoprotein [Mucilaginibacter lappiensis]MBB6107890.1 hypothetical protein [Mucilaginibacter lappiensis]MBB6126040.1 hypothetical protein [Mucilaginibacter lappiensis]SIP93617.1 protein of unknown function [Mucilaginibacter lappiensis]